MVGSSTIGFIGFFLVREIFLPILIFIYEFFIFGGLLGFSAFYKIAIFNAEQCLLQKKLLPFFFWFKVIPLVLDWVRLLSKFLFLVGFLILTLSFWKFFFSSVWNFLEGFLLKFGWVDIFTVKFYSIFLICFFVYVFLSIFFLELGEVIEEELDSIIGFFLLYFFMLFMFPYFYHIMDFWYWNRSFNFSYSLYDEIYHFSKKNTEPATVPLGFDRFEAVSLSSVDMPMDYPPKKHDYILSEMNIFLFKRGFF